MSRQDGQPAGGAGARPGRRRGERAMVPEATFTSYYGRPILKEPAWTHDVPAYFFLGGLSAGSALLGAGGDLTGKESLRRAMRASALASIGAGSVFLVRDLGRPERFANMLRVLRPTSPMSVGSWLLAGYGPLVGLATAGDVLPVLRPLSRVAGLAAAALAPAIATYTAVLTCDTAVPAWHEAYPELPFIFAGSAAGAAGGLGMLLTPTEQAGPARRLAVGGAIAEAVAGSRMERRLGLVGEPYRIGTSGLLTRAGTALSLAGAALGAVGARRSRWASALGGAALLVGSACTRFGIIEAGRVSARDPKYTVVPQRTRLAARSPSR